jgi:hypothetical protein
LFDHSRQEMDSLGKAKKGWVTAQVKGAAEARKASGKEAAMGGSLGKAKQGRPKSSMEFGRDWRRLGSAEERYR